MSKSLSEYVVSVSDDGVLVKVDFLARRRDTCTHKQITFSRLDNELTCVDCGGKINPITWIADYAEQLYRQASRPPKPAKLIK